MNAVKSWICRTGKGWGLWLAVFVCSALVSNAAVEEHFDVLQIGAYTYKNVTVTTKAKDYVFLLHSAGMTSIKVRDLPPELAQQLGYGQKPAGEGKPGLSWLKHTPSALGKQQLPQLEQRLHSLGADRSKMMALVTPRRVSVFLGGMVVLYLGFCYCCAAICRKAGHLPGALVWVPVVQLVPLLRAARMSGWWTLAFLVPVLNLIAQVVWSVKIVQARAKSPWVTLFLLLPATNLFAFLYLAFSDAAPPKEKPVVEIMTLDAA